MKRTLTFTLLATMSILAANAQSPIPIIVPAMTPAVASSDLKPKQAAPSTVAETNSISDAIKLLEQTKAANDETLKKQEALLQQLDELHKAAEQIKIFASRG